MAQLIDLLEYLSDDDRLRVYERFSRLTLRGVREGIIGQGKLIEHKPKDCHSKCLYVTTPSLRVGKYGVADGIFLRAEVARATAEEILRLLEELDL